MVLQIEDTNIYIYIVFASGKCCVSNMFKPSSWPSEGFACRVMRWEPRILRRPARPWSRSEFCRCWIRTGNVALAARCGFLLKDVGEISQVQGFETIPFSIVSVQAHDGNDGKIWQDMASNCTSLCCNSHRSVMLLTTSRPSSKFKSMGPQIGCRSSTKRMTNGLLTCNSSRAGHVHVPHPSYMTCCTFIYIYIRCTHIIIYTRWFEVRTSHEPCASFVQQRKYKRGNLKYTIYPHV